MKLSEQKLRNLIREQINKVLSEDYRGFFSEKFVGKTNEDVYYESRKRRTLVFELSNGDKVRVKAENKFDGPFLSVNHYDPN